MATAPRDLDMIFSFLYVFSMSSACTVSIMGLFGGPEDYTEYEALYGQTGYGFLTGFDFEF